MSPEDFRSWRRRLDLTQTEAAERLGLHRRTVQQYESGANPIPMTVALACAAVEAGLLPTADPIS